MWICAEDTPSPQSFPPLRCALSMAALTDACATGDHTAGHAPCHDHRARDGRCPPLPAHAAAGQDPGGASPAPAAHPGDQHRVRGTAPALGLGYSSLSKVEAERRQCKAAN